MEAGSLTYNVKRHCSRMKRRFLITVAFALLLGVVAALWVVPWVQVQLRIDECLDQGGRWDHEAGQCVLEATELGAQGATPPNNWLAPALAWTLSRRR